MSLIEVHTIWSPCYAWNTSAQGPAGSNAGVFILHRTNWCWSHMPRRRRVSISFSLTPSLPPPHPLPLPFYSISSSNLASCTGYIGYRVRWVIPSNCCPGYGVQGTGDVGAYPVMAAHVPVIVACSRFARDFFVEVNERRWK